MRPFHSTLTEFTGDLGGLMLRGAFHPAPEDAVPDLDGAAPGTLVLLGFAGGVGWPAFAASPEARDDGADRLDRWSRRVIDALAARWGGEALYPVGGPPWLPFQRWARRADTVFASPLGLLVHPQYGLWHSYRGAVALRERLDLVPAEAASPCQSCVGRPCLSACPVGAFSAAGYDVDACAGHLTTAAGADCMALGCRARRACPVGAAQRYGTEEAAFYMGNFVASRG